MRAPEQRLYDSFRAACCPKYLRGDDVERIENGVGAGIPDVLISVPGAFVFVEFKVARLPARGTSKVLGAKGLNAHQKNWHHRAARARQPVYTLIRDDAMTLYFIHCEHSQWMNDAKKSDLDRASVAGDWRGICEVILGHKNFLN